MQIEYIQSLFNQPSGDFVFKLSDQSGEKKFYAHKFLLASSLYFQTLFSTSIGESKDKDEMAISNELVFYVGIAAFYLKKPALGDILTMTTEEFKALCADIKTLDCPVDWNELMSRLSAGVYDDLLLSNVDFVLTYFPEKENEVFESHVTYRGYAEAMKDPVFSNATKMLFAMKEAEKEAANAKYDHKNRNIHIIEDDYMLKHLLKTKNLDLLKYYCDQQ